MGSFIWRGVSFCFCTKIRASLEGGGWGHKQGHLQPLQSPQGAQPETPVVWPLLPGPGWVLFYSLYNINRISMYTWAWQHSAEALSLSPQQVHRARSLCPVLCHLRSAVSPGARGPMVAVASKETEPIANPWVVVASADRACEVCALCHSIRASSEGGICFLLPSATQRP